MGDSSSSSNRSCGGGRNDGKVLARTLALVAVVLALVLQHSLMQLIPIWNGRRFWTLEVIVSLDYPIPLETRLLGEPWELQTPLLVFDWLQPVMRVRPVHQALRLDQLTQHDIAVTGLPASALTGHA